ncbi:MULTISPECIES: hypothetical protein [unclassified Burkholderia]|uniref:hypothetical protein n=1 Tax=unclassified Burkholderia TaxID=2613784 RepID=UPI0014201E72|nr:MULTISPECIES: hypothetical protein [unclassified Burkholderia]NIE82380.1 hypothetical protein [Burkholderia sp. Tr-860]NIF61271.1 hypothetical protein [Burkholderia sp. Cy-647]NIF96188.1 hypothetical protein [Burkholderia sp. Ax-1720]
MSLEITLSLEVLTVETERVIHQYMRRADQASHPSRKALYEDVALGAFLLWSHLACEASTKNPSPTALRDYDAAMNRLQALTQPRSGMIDRSSKL